MGQCSLDSQTFLLCSGPKEWTGNCKGASQSPIILSTAKAKVNLRLSPFTFVGYDQRKSWTVTNNQHTGGSCMGLVESPGRDNCAGMVSLSSLEMGEATGGNLERGGCSR